MRRDPQLKLNFISKLIFIILRYSDELRAHLKTMPKVPVVQQKEAQEDSSSSSSSSDSDSSSSSDSDSSSSSDDSSDDGKTIHSKVFSLFTKTVHRFFVPRVIFKRMDKILDKIIVVNSLQIELS